jgi:hypothetical protein
LEKSINQMGHDFGVDNMDLMIRRLLITSGYRINKDLYDRNLAQKPKIDSSGRISGYQDISLVKALQAVCRERFDARDSKPSYVIPGVEGVPDEVGGWKVPPRARQVKPAQVARQADPNMVKEIDHMIKHVISKNVGEMDMSGMSVILSQNPHDVAKMSTEKQWTSCMNLVDGGNRKYVCSVIQKGGFIGYVVKLPEETVQQILSDPSREIGANEALARIIVKPFVDPKDPTQVAAVPEMRVYSGIKGQSLGQHLYGTVHKWISQQQTVPGGRYRRTTGYSDSFSKMTTIAPRDEETLLQWLKSQYPNRQRAAAEQAVNSHADTYTPDFIRELKAYLFANDYTNKDLVSIFVKKWPQYTTMDDGKTINADSRRLTGLADDWQFELDDLIAGLGDSLHYALRGNPNDMHNYIIPKLLQTIEKTQMTAGQFSRLANLLINYKGKIPHNDAA